MIQKHPRKEASWGCPKEWLNCSTASSLSNFIFSNPKNRITWENTPHTRTRGLSAGGQDKYGGECAAKPNHAHLRYPCSRMTQNSPTQTETKPGKQGVYRAQSMPAGEEPKLNLDAKLRQEGGASNPSEQPRASLRSSVSQGSP